jgi:hypothetical protein
MGPRFHHTLTALAAANALENPRLFRQRNLDPPDIEQLFIGGGVQTIQGRGSPLFRRHLRAERPTFPSVANPPNPLA